MESFCRNLPPDSEVCSCKTVRAGYKSAPYKVVRKEGEFELRQYDKLIIVEAPRVSSDGKKAADNGFMRLFHYISGENEGAKKIAMTTPVFMEGNGSNATMAFVMPADVNLASTPKPKDGSLKTRELAAGRFAVYRFSGGQNFSNETNALSQLQAWMQKSGFNPSSAAIYAYFDPPWTPTFLRRNEVMLRVH